MYGAVASRPEVRHAGRRAARPAHLHAARPRADLSMASADQVPGTEVPAAEFRDAMGYFATGVSVVTSVGADGTPVGTTANAVTSLSLDPPLILVCFDLGSLTLRAIQEHGAFAVNVLAAGQKHLSAGFARRGLAAAWDHVRHHRHGPTG